MLSDASVTIKNAMHPGEAQRERSEHIASLLDSELGDVFVARLRELRREGTRLGDALRHDRPLCEILAEFRRRAEAHAAARERYRRRLRAVA